MNLLLDFNSNPAINKNIVECSKSPVEFTETGARIKFIRPPRYDSSDYPLWKDIQNIDTLWDTINSEEFANVTGMRDIVAFKETLETLNTWLYDAFQIKDKIDVTKSYAWKKGCYDIVKHAIMSSQMFHKRPAGMSSLFNRIQDNRWLYDQLQRQIKNLDNYREKAKAAEISLDSNLDSIIESQRLAYDNIIESTNQANAMSDYYKVYNYIEPADNYIDIKLYTIVHCKAKDMTIINNRNEEICKMKVSECYLKFHRPLYKALNGGTKYPIHYLASVVDGKHPYINAIPYRRISHPSIDKYAWNTLCLSSYTDDIESSLYKNDFMSFVMGIMNWNNIYNKDATNPYATITQVMAYGTFPDAKNEDEVRRLKTVLSINQNDLFSARYHKHVITELDSVQRDWNERIHKNYSPYARFIIEEYDSKNCPTRESCIGYQNLKAYFESDAQYMIEEILGNFFINENSSKYDVDFDFQELESLIMMLNDSVRHENLWDLVVNRRYSDETDYWNTAPEPTDNNPDIAAMQAKISQWEQQLAASGGINE
tara:strand:+ start:186 stop:1808 length:1623 start_codon:yes stop_codon:yes gene_type:complete